MKTLQPDSILSLALVLALVIISATTLRAQPRLTAAQLAALTPLNPTAVPRAGTFWRWKGPWPGHDYPPLPCPPDDLGDVPIYALGGGQFLIDDSQVDYDALRQQQQMDRALSNLEAQYGLRRSEEDGGTFRPMGLASYSPDDLWLELIAVTNATGYLVVHPPAAEATSGVYDLFMTTNLSLNVPGLNLTNWLWLLRTGPGETNLVVADLTAAQTYFVLGRTNDSDGDLLSDAWERLVGGTDPNTPDASAISFSLSLPYDCVTNTVITGAVSVTSGFPTLMAVLVNGTNLDNAAWVPLNTPFAVDLGSADGRKEIWVGLRGPLPNIPPAWQWTRVTLDRTAPLLVITNPVNPAVSRPVIQLKGYSPEPLVSLIFDATNALGEVTHGRGLIVDQFYDPTIPDLTTNWFECLDIQLAQGTNFVTLTAADRAGNIGQTNLAYVFGTNGAQAPVITIIWPQDGSRLSGTNFTLRGTVDDETAVVTAQIAVAGGPTSTATALVERSGNFWVENLPLADGTNFLTVTAINAAGMLSTTNLTVVKSGMALTINAVPADQLHRLRVTVTGSVGDPSYGVWVNGVPAVVDSSGNWSAADVPVTRGCTASFTATAYPADEIPSLNEAGQGTNPTTPNSCDFTLDEDKPPQVYVQYYELDYSFVATNYFLLRGAPESGHQHVLWEQDSPATDRYDLVVIGYTAGTAGPELRLSSWPTDTWEPVLYGTNVHTLGTSFAETNTVGPPIVPMEQCEIAGPAQYYNISDGKVEPAYYSRVAKTVVKYFTGGKDAPGSQNLHELNATLNSKTFQWFFDQSTTLDGTNIIDGATAGVFGQLGSNGLAYAALDDGQHVVITPTKAGVPYQGADLPTITEYKPLIFRDGHLVNGLTNTTVVGERQNLNAILANKYYDPVAAPVSCQWSVPGNVVSNFYVSPEPNPLSGYPVPWDNKTNQDIHYYWYLGGSNLAVQCIMTVTTNGQSLSVTGKTTFNVIRPTADWTAETNAIVTVDDNYYAPALHFGYKHSAQKGMLFHYRNPQMNGYNETGWVFKWAQLANYYERANLVATNAGMVYIQAGLDYNFPAGDFSGASGDDSDDPGAWTTGKWKVFQQAYFTNYLMFDPNPGTDNSIPVPVRKLVWSWSGTATNDLTQWILLSPPNGASILLNNADATEFPAWSDNATNRYSFPTNSF